MTLRSKGLTFCCWNLILHQKRNENDKNTIFFDKKCQVTFFMNSPQWPVVWYDQTFRETGKIYQHPFVRRTHSYLQKKHIRALNQNSAAKKAAPRKKTAKIMKNILNKQKWSDSMLKFLFSNLQCFTHSTERQFIIL